MPITTLTIFLLTLASAIITSAFVYRLIVHVTKGATKELGHLATALSFFIPAWAIKAIDTIPAIHENTFALIFAPYGIAWGIEHILFVIGTISLVRWAWHYISLRLLPQFYLSVVAIGLTAFVVSTVIFTTVLFKSAEDQALRSIEADVKTFSLTLSELKDRTAFVSAAIAARENLTQAAQENNREQTTTALGDPIADYNISAAYILNAGGELITTIGTESDFGQSFSTDPVVKRVLEGKIVGSPLLEEGVEAPSMIIRAGSPLVKDGQVIGAVIIDTPIDTAFVDRIGSITGLEVTVYAEEHRTATTIRDDSGRPLVPETIEDKTLAEVTLHQGKVFRSSSTLGSKPYFIAAIPVNNIDDARVGILTAGLPAQTLIENLKSSTQISFLVSFALLILSLGPFYILARLLTKQVSEAK